MGEIASQLVRLNRKLAWLLVIVTAVVLITGYAQSMSIAGLGLTRQLHLIVEWLFVAILTSAFGVVYISGTLYVNTLRLYVRTSPLFFMRQLWHVLI